MALPLVAGDRPSASSRSRAGSPPRSRRGIEAFLDIIANQIASAIDAKGGTTPSPQADAPVEVTPSKPTPPRPHAQLRSDDCVFSDDGYLVRNVPGASPGRCAEGHQASGCGVLRTASSASARRPARHPRQTSRAGSVLLVKRSEAKLLSSSSSRPRAAGSLGITCLLELSSPLESAVFSGG